MRGFARTLGYARTVAMFGVATVTTLRYVFRAGTRLTSRALTDAAMEVPHLKIDVARQTWKMSQDTVGEAFEAIEAFAEFPLPEDPRYSWLISRMRTEQILYPIHQ